MASVRNFWIMMYGIREQAAQRPYRDCEHHEVLVQ